MKAWPEVYIPALAERFILPTLTLHDTASGQLSPLNRATSYRLYVCGITPYDATHLGHAATYLTFDLVNRYLRATGAEVNLVQNITDIDEPLLERAERDGVNWQSLADSQVDLFRSDMSALHIIPPNHYVGVVESMPIIIEAVLALIDKKVTYQIDKYIYFRVNSDPNFLQRSHLSKSEELEIFAQRGGDPNRPGKENQLDALIWRAARQGEPSWPSPMGAGRPGWHIECSAIALNYLQRDGENTFSVDIQGGGSDLIFPHHEISAAQSYAITGREFAQLYVHAGMIGLSGEKMSKSLGNLVLVSDLLSRGTPAMAIRWALMSRRYEEDATWDEDRLQQSISEISALHLALAREEVAPTDSVIEVLIESLAKNLDTPAAIAELNRWSAETIAGSTGGSAGELSRAIDTLLGVAL